MGYFAVLCNSLRSLYAKRSSNRRWFELLAWMFLKEWMSLEKTSAAWKINDLIRGRWFCHNRILENLLSWKHKVALVTWHLCCIVICERMKNGMRLCWFTEDNGIVKMTSQQSDGVLAIYCVTARPLCTHPYWCSKYTLRMRVLSRVFLFLKSKVCFCTLWGLIVPTAVSFPQETHS